jgi:hypothetical protein
MKWAPIVGGVALGAVLLVVATAKPAKSGVRTVALDVAGVDTLVVVAPDSRVTIAIASKLAATAEYCAEEKVSAVREGARLRVTSATTGCTGLTLVVPATVHTLVVDSAGIVAREHVGNLRIEAEDAVDWSGGADRLEIVGTGAASPCVSRGTEDAYCPASLNVEIREGEVGTLRLQGARVDVSLVHPDLIGAGVFDLGDEGHLMLRNATRVDNLHIVRHTGEPASDVHVSTPAPPDGH